MNNAATVEVEKKEDALKYAYAFMKTEKLYIKECSFVNPNPKQFNKEYLIPRDMYSASYTEDVPAWETFKSNPAHLSSPSFMCVASLDKGDKKRVVLAYLDSKVFFNYYGNYKDEAKKTFENITSTYLSIQ